MPEDQQPESTSFLALYRGPDVERARVVALTAAPEVVALFAEVLLEREGGSGDLADQALALGRREALRIIRDEAAAEEERDR